MTIKRLQSAIGGKIVKHFDYNVNMEYRFYAIAISINTLNGAIVSFINNNGFVAVVKNYRNMKGERTIVAMIYQANKSELELIK